MIIQHDNYYKLYFHWFNYDDEVYITFHKIKEASNWSIIENSPTYYQLFI